MFKKFVLFVLLLIPVGAIAQEAQKIAHINRMEIIMAMPEFAEMQSQLEAEQAAFEKEMSIMNEDYTKKYQAFMAESDSLVESIRIRRLQEIQDIEQRAQTYSQQTQERFQTLQQTLFTPIQEKVQTAINSVGFANNFAYVLDVSGGATVVYVNPKSIDATALVKKELGIK